MTWKRGISCGISEIFSLSSVFHKYRPGFRVLMYHAVGTNISDDPLGIYSIDSRLFRQHMAFLIQMTGVSVVGFEDGKGSGEALEIAVTFDDGYKDNLYVAAPILQDFNIPFSVFVSTQFVKDGSAEYLDEAELKELAAIPGAAIGAHGVKHLALADLKPGELKRELLDSRHYLEDVLGKPIQSMSYPHGSISQQVRDAVEEAGYLRAACSRSDINDAFRDRLLLCRTMIDARDSQRNFKQKLRGNWDWYRYLQKDVKVHE